MEEDSFYLLKSGKVKIRKKAPNAESIHTIAIVEQGEVIGESALTHHKPRTANVQAYGDIVLYKFNVTLLKNDPSLADCYRAILTNLSTDLVLRVQTTNQKVAQHLVEKMNEYRMRVGFGIFLINLFCVISIYTLSLTIIRQSFSESQTAFFSFVMLSLLLFLCLFTMYKTNLSPRLFGFNTNNLKQSIYESVFFSFLIIALITLIKFIVISTSNYSGSLIEPNLGISSDLSILSYPLFLAFIGYLLFCPIQEFVSRGVLQSLFYMFYPGNEFQRNLIAILLSNLIVTLLHAHTSLTFALAAFIPGLFWGWLFARHKNLMCVSLSHMIIGGYSVFVLGIDAFVFKS